MAVEQNIKMDDATLEIPGTVTEEQPLLILNGSFLIAVFFILLQAFSFLSVFLTNLALNPKDKLHSSYKLSTWHSFRVVHIPGRSRGHVVHVDGDGVSDISFRVSGLTAASQLTATDVVWLD